MKATKFLFIILILSISCSPAKESAEEDSTPIDEVVVDETEETQENTNKEGPDIDVSQFGLLNEREQDGFIAKGEFYPIGFSEKGNLAFAFFSYEYWTFVIQSLVSDEILYQFLLEYEESDDINQILKANWKSISEQMEQYEILFEGDFSPGVFPIETGNDIITATSATSDFFEYSEFGGFKHAIWLTSSERGSKRISEIETLAGDSEIMGYIKSPYEERLAVVVATIGEIVTMGLTVEINVIGASLNSGFRANQSPPEPEPPGNDGMFSVIRPSYKNWQVGETYTDVMWFIGQADVPGYFALFKTVYDDTVTLVYSNMGLPHPPGESFKVTWKFDSLFSDGLYDRKFIRMRERLVEFEEN